MRLAGTRSKNSDHLRELLPQLGIVHDKDGRVMLLLQYGGHVAHLEVDDKVFNSAETDYHKEAIEQLMTSLATKIQKPVEKKITPAAYGIPEAQEILDSDAKDAVPLVAKIRFVETLDHVARFETRKTVLRAVAKRRFELL